MGAGCYNGWIYRICEKKDVSSPEAKDFERDFQKEEYQHLVMEEPVNLSWHQVTSEEANAYLPMQWQM